MGFGGRVRDYEEYKTNAVSTPDFFGTVLPQWPCAAHGGSIATGAGRFLERAANFQPHKGGGGWGGGGGWKVLLRCRRTRTDTVDVFGTWQAD